MIERNGYRGFGFFKGSPYGVAEESFLEYEKIHNNSSKRSILRHIGQLEPALTSAPTYDIFTGEKFQAGLFTDGDFVFTTDFAKYYREHDIGIPAEYERYLVENSLI